MLRGGRQIPKVFKKGVKILGLTVLLLIIGQIFCGMVSAEGIPEEFKRPESPERLSHTNELVHLISNGDLVKILIVTEGYGPITGVPPEEEKDFWKAILEDKLSVMVDWYDGVPTSELLKKYDLVIYDAGGYWYPLSNAVDPLWDYHFSGKPLIVVSPDINYDWWNIQSSSKPSFLQDVLHIEGALGIMPEASYEVTGWNKEILGPLYLKTSIIREISSWPDCFDPSTDGFGLLTQGYIPETEFGVGTCSNLPSVSPYDPKGSLYAAVTYSGSIDRGKVATFGFPLLAVGDEKIRDILAEKTIEWALGKEIASKKELAEKYKPLFIFHHEENYRPVPVNTMIDNGFVINPDQQTSESYVLKQIFGKNYLCLDVDYAKIVEDNPTPDKLIEESINKESYQLTFNPTIREKYKIEDYTPIRAAEKTLFCIDPLPDYSPNDIINKIGTKTDYVDYEEGYHKPTIYAYVTKDEYKGNEYVAIEYWFYYVYNEFTQDYHEGEGEGIVILLDPETLEPVQVAYYQHLWGDAKKWSEIEKKSTHPKIYVGKGSHASFFNPGIFGFQMGIIYCDRTSDEKSGDVPELENIKVELLEKQPWLDFKGEWCGRKLGIFTPFVTVKGFKYAKLEQTSDKWNEPADCVFKLAGNKKLEETFKDGISVSLFSPGYITVTNENGEFIGYINGTFFNNMSNAGIGADGYIVPFGGEYIVEVVGTEKGNITLRNEIFQPNWSKEIIYADDSVNETTIATLKLNATSNNPMNFDYNGDGIIDETKLPDLIKEETPNEEVNSIKYIPSGGSLTLFIVDPIYKLTIYAKENISNALIKLKGLEELPVPSPPGKAIYKNFSIEKNFSDDAMNYATIEFFVEKDFLRDIGATKENVSMFRYNEEANQWESIPTSISGEDELKFFYEANVSKLSYFSISSMKVNELPIAQFTYSPDFPDINQTVIFNASDSYDPDGSIIGYEWNFSDGTIGYGKIAKHAFLTDGKYPVNLTVTDDSGGTGTRIKIISVNLPPVADANGPYSGVIEYIAVPITFDGTGSYDPDGTIVSYEWDLDNDGKFDDAVGTTPTVSFTAPYSGNIHLKVTDNNGATDTDTTTLTITKHSPPPNGIHGGLLTPPEQPQCYRGTSTIQGKGHFIIDESIQDWATAIDTTEHIEGTGEFAMDSKKVLNQAANPLNFYDPNFHYKKTMQFQGNATNRLISRDKFESSGIFGGTGTRINEYFDVSMIQKDESGSIKTISAPGSGQSHRFATMDDFSGIWGIHSGWQKICQKDIRHHQMFIGNFSVQKDLTFEREIVIP